MLRIWTVLLLAIGAPCSSQSSALAPGAGRCDDHQIRSAILSTGQFPNLRGCDPSVVRNALGDTDYALQIESRASSNRIGEGLIIRQRVQGATVFVVVSSGRDHRDSQPGSAIGEALGQIVVG